jgi:NAD(P)H dehydrogenase (quinone)
MRVLTVFAHPQRKSFCHAILEQFSKGLADSGHVNEVVDLYAMKFDPVFRTADFASYVHESMPTEILEAMNLKQRVLESAGNPVTRLAASLWLRDKSLVQIARFIHSQRPKDVIEQWEKVKNAEGLAFISPVYWLHFPAILKGWFERVFSYGDAYSLTPVGWQGYAKGRVPLMKHKKALVINTTIFSERDYKSHWELPMKRIIDEWGLRYPGVKKVQHVYFYRAAVADEKTLKGYLKRSYELGRDFAEA